MTLYIRAFHMASIVISLYFKQENCETLISQYNCRRMKRCQLELDSCKVEWFCSLSSFHGGLALLCVCLCLCLSLPLLSELRAHPFLYKTEKKLVSREPRGEGCIIKSANCSQLQLCKYSQSLLHVVWLWETTAGFNQQQASALQTLLVFTPLPQCTRCICCLFA